MSSGRHKPASGQRRSWQDEQMGDSSQFLRTLAQTALERSTPRGRSATVTSGGSVKRSGRAALRGSSECSTRRLWGRNHELCSIDCQGPHLMTEAASGYNCFHGQQSHRVRRGGNCVLGAGGGAASPDTRRHNDRLPSPSLPLMPPAFRNGDGAARVVER